MCKKVMRYSPQKIIFRPVISIIFFLMLLSFYHCTLIASNFNIGSRYSTLAIAPGSRLVQANTFEHFSGTLENEGIIQGAPFVFERGVLSKNGLYNDFSGTYHQAGEHAIIMTTNGVLRATPGQCTEKIVAIREGNRLEGMPLFSNTNAIELTSNLSVLTLAIPGSLTSNITLNGGTLELEQPLQYSQDAKLTGSGSVVCNGNVVAFGAYDHVFTDTLLLTTNPNMALHGTTRLAGNWIFDGTTSGNKAHLDGHGNVLDLSLTGSLVIKSGVTLNLANIKVTGLGKGGFIFEDQTSQLRLSHVELELSNCYSVTMGGIYVDAESRLVAKNHLLTFEQKGSLTVDGTTFWYDPMAYVQDYNIRPRVIDPINAGNQYVTLLNGGFIHDVPSSELVRMTSQGLVYANRINSNSLLYAIRTASNSLQYYHRTMSNALLYGDRINSNSAAYHTRINSNTLAYNFRTNSNALELYHRVDSNMIDYHHRITSAALLYGDRINSNSAAYHTRINSNTLAYNFRTNSNALELYHRVDSNMIDYHHRTTSAALLYGDRINSNSAAYHTRINSNTLAYNFRINSNALEF
ncbi:MAG: hypothetical protein US69_C0001G0054, partial [candidate division TM6 bacterium GW2011_GWF2_38_10]